MMAAAIASGRRVEVRWAALTSAQQIESLRHSLQALLSQLQHDSGTELP